MLAIGEFSRLTHLSVRTLRRYHEAGLLVPAAVDRATGYRSYDGRQIPTAQVIHRLRELDVPLADVRRIVESADPDRRPRSCRTTWRAWRPSWTGPGLRSCRCAGSSIPPRCR